MPAHLLESDEHVRVKTQSSRIVFTPTSDTSGVGLVFFPGALVDPEAYVPFAREVAESGFLVIIQKLPWRLAPFKSHRLQLFKRTRELLKQEQSDRKWVIGGHSKGGALAAEFAANNFTLLSGLLLIGTTHPRERDLSELTIDTVKLVGSKDGLASPEEVEKFQGLLPQNATIVLIEGGNHAHFAWYGWQLGDGFATISREEQHGKTVEETIRLLSRIASIQPPA